MNVVVHGFVSKTLPRRGSKSDFEETVEVVLRGRTPYAVLARGYFKRWQKVRRIRIYNALGQRLGTYTRTSYSKVERPPKKTTRYKPAVPRVKKKSRNPRTGWAAHRGRGGL